MVLGVIYGRRVVSRAPYPRFTAVGASLQRMARCAACTIDECVPPSSRFDREIRKCRRAHTHTATDARQYITATGAVLKIQARKKMIVPGPGYSLLGHGYETSAVISRH